MDPVEAFNSIESVLERFESNALAIIAYAQANSIFIPPSVKKAETAAKYVFEYYQMSSDEEE